MPIFVPVVTATGAPLFTSSGSPIGLLTEAYTDLTLGEAWGEMGRRLYDPDHVRWPTDELTLYIQQAIRTYNALTNHFRDETAFATWPGTAFYDLTAVAPDLRALTFTVRQAVDQILWQLMEPPLNGALWTGTEQYSLGDILSALQQARDTFLLFTGVIQTQSDLAVSLPARNGIVVLPEAVINLRRLTWKTADGIIIILRRTDAWGLTNYGGSWQTASTRRPSVYSVSTQPPLEVRLAPITTVPGTLDLVSVNRGPAVTIVPDALLGVPDDWAWVVIFGALAQLLQRDGLALDPARAAYCESRWDQGLERARMAPVVLAGNIEGRTLPLGSYADADAYSAAWQMVPGVPRRLLTAGQTLVGTWPVAGVRPGGGNFAVTLEVVRNAPVPVLEDDYLQIGPELVNDILDYSQHLASFKEGVGALQSSMGLLDQFMSLCGLTLKVQKASQPDEPQADQQTVQDARTVPYLVEP